MEELKILVEMVASLPEMAVWVLVAFFVYKVIFIGGLFSLLKYVVSSLVKILTKQNSINDMCVSIEVQEQLIVQLKRLTSYSSHIASSDVLYLKQALDKMNK